MQKEALFIEPSPVRIGGVTYTVPAWMVVLANAKLGFSWALHMTQQDRFRWMGMQWCLDNGASEMLTELLDVLKELHPGDSLGYVQY